uniref:Myb/SANT-like domain-containing protein n=1 Tax=Aegilops tauschii TaxID=37682 RepID=M8B493_AEGTA
MVAEWTIKNTRIITELFAEQVKAGIRLNTHLTANAYEEVGRKFKIRTGLEHTYNQLKNKWEKLRSDYSVFKKLYLKETGAGWDIEHNTVKQDAEWRNKAKIVNSILRCAYHIFSLVVKIYYLCCIVGHSRLLQVHRLRNEENLRFMFGDITSDGSDHWNPSFGTPPSTTLISSAINLEQIEDVDLLEDTQVPSPITPKVNKRLEKIICDTNKRPKTTQVMQVQITMIGSTPLMDCGGFLELGRSGQLCSWIRGSWELASYRTGP